MEENDEKITLKKLLQHMKHYGSRVTIETVRQLPNVTLTSNVKSIIQQLHDIAHELNEVSDMEILIERVRKYIRTEIKSMEHHYSNYSTTEDMGSVDANVIYLLHSLQLLLGNIIESKNEK